MQRLGVAGTAVPAVLPDLGTGHVQSARDAACARLRGAAEAWAKRRGRGHIALRRIAVRGASDRLLSGDGVPPTAHPMPLPTT